MYVTTKLINRIENYAIYSRHEYGLMFVMVVENVRKCSGQESCRWVIRLSARPRKDNTSIVLFDCSSELTRSSTPETAGAGTNMLIGFRLYLFFFFFCKQTMTMFGGGLSQ